MIEPLGPPDHQSDLIAIIGRVKRRWRLKLAARGAATCLVLGLAALLLAAYGLEWARFSPASIIAFRVLVPVIFLGLVGYLFVRPLLQRVTDEQVALYLEEHEPSLQAAIVSAVEASRAPQANSSTSAALVARLVESAIEKCAAVGSGRHIEQGPLRRYAGVLAGTAVVAAALFTFGPGYLRSAVSALLHVSSNVEAAAPYRIDVTPGNATIPKGADQTITARLSGFDAGEATLMVRTSPDAPFDRLPMVAGEGGSFDGMLFDLAGEADYFVEAAGVRSPVFTLKVVELPYVQRLELEYHFPAYTGLEPRTIEDGGDIAVLKGTEVRVRVTPTMTVGGGRIALHDTGSAALAAQPDGTLTTSFTVDRDGFYRVELDAPTGQRVAASPQYTIDVLSDEGPTVSFTKPGRDRAVTNIEEVFLEVRAEDDYGVRRLELVYSVNGGDEQTVRLFDGKTRLDEVIAGHTLYLEELKVEPGDSVAYYARAADNSTAGESGGAHRATSDLYFLRIRPFGKEFRAAQSQASGGGGGGGGNVDALSEQQRQIISATFNVQRDRRTYSADKLRESTVVVALAQSRLREQVESLLTRMNSRLLEQDPSFERIGQLLPQAVEAMKEAETELQAIRPERGLAPEQRALKFLQLAEEEYELQVSMSQNAGGGGGTSSMAEELADLFEMELDRMANQYEMASRAEQQGADDRLDELAEKLKELARRQEQEAERQRRRASAGQPSGGGAQQRALAEQAEEAARALERLSREANQPQLMDSARQLRDAAEAMRRAAASGDPGAAGQASAALERLRRTAQQLQQSQSARVERDVKNALQQAEELARDQRGLADEVRRLPGAGAARESRAGQIGERKDALESKVGELEKQLDRTASDASRDEREASRRVAEAAKGIRDSRVRDKLRYSKALLGSDTPPDVAQGLEADIGSNLDALRDKLREAVGALGQARRDPETEALDRARRLARGLESLEERTRERLEGREGAGERADAGRERGQRGDQGAEAGEGARESAQSSQGQAGQQGAQSGQAGQQAQGGQQGESGQAAEGQTGGQGGGRNDSGSVTAGRGGVGDTRGQWTGGGGYGDRRPGRLSPEDIRQFRGEVRQWSNEAQQLRRLLREEELDPKTLDAILQALAQMDDDRVFQDVEELARLQTFVTEGLKRFEYGLRRKIELAGREVVLSGADEVPESFRAQVEEYYRTLSNKPR